MKQSPNPANKVPYNACVKKVSGKKPNPPKSKAIVGKL